MSRRRGWRPCLLQTPQSAGTPRSHPVHAIDRVANVMERSRRARYNSSTRWEGEAPSRGKDLEESELVFGVCLPAPAPS